MQKVALVDSVNKERKRWEEVVDGLRNLLRNEREGKEKAVAAALAEANPKCKRTWKSLSTRSVNACNRDTVFGTKRFRKAHYTS